MNTKIKKRKNETAERSTTPTSMTFGYIVKLNILNTFFYNIFFFSIQIRASLA